MSVSVIISELQDEKGSAYRSNSKSVGKSYASPIEEELTQLIETCQPRKHSKNMHPSYSKKMDLLRESALKKPAIEICESVTIKQALRKLCISQASEMAAMKRVSKSIGVAVSSEAGTIKRLYTAVVVHSSQPGKDKHDRLLQISLLPERKNSKSSEKVSESIGKKSCNKEFQPSSTISEITTTAKAMKPKIREVLSSTLCNKKIQSSSKISEVTTTAKAMKPKIRDVLSSSPCNKKIQSSSKFDDTMITAIAEKPKIRDVLSSTPGEGGRKLQRCLMFRKDEKKKLDPPSDTILKNANLSRKSPVSPGTLVKPTVRPTSKNKSYLNNQGSSSEKGVSLVSNGNEPCSKKDSTCSTPIVGKEDQHFETKSGSTSYKSKYEGFRTKKRVIFQSKGKGDFSQSSSSSIGDYSTSTSNSGESNQSGSCAGVRPHMSNDVRWDAIRHVEVHDGNIGLKNFKLHKRLGCGDIGTVYLAELIGSGCLFALKVMDNEFLISRNKITRVQTETEILQMLDHPFLPTLYTYFTTDNLSCLAMEYCPGGDLHVLRQKQYGRSFSEPAARFYVAEVLLALEYLHMLGVVYRDLKPENILVREDGHIMLSDFDLSLRCGVNPPSLWRSSSAAAGTVESQTGFESYCIGSGFLEPSCAQVSCFTPRLASAMSGTAKRGGARLPQLVVEPVEARSNSFVGTHEYLAPEIIKGEDHGSCVDWWTFGIFLYELVFGTTPFKGSDNEETLSNVVSKKLQFPDDPNISFHATDLIRKLLVKEADRRLGSARGAAEIKQHPFFMGLNWALIRCATPPEVPHPHPSEPPPSLPVPSKYLEFGSNGEGVEFELF